MLKRKPFTARPARARQRGMVLLVALIVLAAMMIAGTAMMRSVDTATLVAGNLAFQQAATHAADKGVEAAVTMLRQKKADGTLDDHDPSNGYFASLQAETDNPDAGQTWQQFWHDTLDASAYDVGEDGFSNHIYFVVHRVCANPSPPNSGGECVASPAVTSMVPDPDPNVPPIKAATSIYYRVTVRVTGPRRTESYVQSHIAM